MEESPKKDVQTFVNAKSHSAAIEPSSLELSMTPMRKTIAQHMVQSKHTSAHVTTVFEVDMTNIVVHRKTNQTSYADNDIKLTYTAYFLYACALALSSHKIINSMIVDDKILIKDDINIGFAVSLGEDGLIVPVIRETDKKTLTNHGVFGSVVATAIINQPQCAILGIGVIQKRVVVIEDIMEIRPMVYISLTFDHRIIDGAYADEFLKKVKTELEQWT